MLNQETKKSIIDQNAIHDKDTGSVEVQIALLSERISQISNHLKKFPKDKHSHYGLVKLLGRRRAFNKYLSRKAK